MNEIAFYFRFLGNIQDKVALLDKIEKYLFALWALSYKK